jgi:sodium-dependent phosphate transporter
MFIFYTQFNYISYSGTLTMNQAVFLAAAFEFTGAMILGQTNVNVIAGGIADRASFSGGNQPYLYAYGMMIVMWVGGIFQLTASMFQLNVSATHAVIGGILGFALAHKGSDGVLWIVPKLDSQGFPYTGLVPVIVAWFLSPVATAFVSFLIFVTVRTLVLRTSQAVKLSYVVLPILIFITIFINVYFVFTKGAKSQLAAEQWSVDKNAWVAASIAAGCAVVSVAAIPFIMARVAVKMKQLDQEESTPKALKDEETIPEPTKPEGAMMKYLPNFIRNMGVLSPEEKARLESENTLDEFDPSAAEKFNTEAEVIFSYLQVVTAIAVIFAHGSNEVGYSTGPLGTIYDVVMSSTQFYQGSSKGFIGKAPKLPKVTVPAYWNIGICATGLVLGLATYGQRLTRAVAYKLVKLSATRGFAAELATAIVITLTAQYGLPTSSSQCITGGIIGVGLAEGNLHSVNWKYFFKNLTAWIFTMFIMAITVGLIYAQGTFAPLEVNP